MAYVGAPSEQKIHGVPKWQAESDLSTLKSAHEIHGDKKRHKAARHLAKQQIGSLQHLASGKRLGAK